MGVVCSGSATRRAVTIRSEGPAVVPATAPLQLIREKHAAAIRREAGEILSVAMQPQTLAPDNL